MPSSKRGKRAGGENIPKGKELSFKTKPWPDPKRNLTGPFPWKKGERGRRHKSAGAEDSNPPKND